MMRRVVLGVNSRAVACARSVMPARPTVGAHVAPRIAVRRRPLSTQAPFGAPYTNSVTFKPKPMAASYPPTADTYTLSLRIPNLPPAELELYSRDELAYILQQLKEKLGVQDVAMLIGGKRWSAASLQALSGSQVPTLKDVFQQTVDLEVVGVRYNVNGGDRITAMGSAAKRTMATSYAYAGIGAAVAIWASFALWKAVIPREQQRK